MTISFDQLPTDLQADIVEMRAIGIPEDLIERHATNTVRALGRGANRVQVEVLDMESRLGDQLNAIGVQLHNDLQSQHGATNDMLSDLHAAIEELASWRSRIETAIAALYEARDLSLSERAELQQAKDFAADERARLEAKLNGAIERIEVIEQILEIAPEAPTSGGGDG